jgi:menaquinone-dependent protoporphyrinogen oxidase
MAHILIVYSTTDGHTQKISLRLKAVIEQQAHQVTVAAIDEPALDLESFDKIVIGASIRYGKHHRNVYRFVEANRAVLGAKPSAFFTVNVVARKPAKNTPETNPYMQKFLSEIPWKPRELAVFAGKIDYPKYRFWDRQMIRLIMWLTKGPTNADAVVEFTDWQQVDAFGRQLSQMDS